MAACEKCWADAYTRMVADGGSQVRHYHDILRERRGNPCSIEEQTAHTGVDLDAIRREAQAEAQAQEASRIATFLRDQERAWRKLDADRAAGLADAAAYCEGRAHGHSSTARKLREGEP